MPSHSIMFVYGLFGHPRKTWEAKKKRSKSPRPSSSKARAHAHLAVERPQNSGSQLPKPSSDENEESRGLNLEEEDAVYWPQSLLPMVIPDVKIFTFGYDADIDGFLPGAGQNTINQHAQSLLSDLSDLRSSPAEVSFISRLFNVQKGRTGASGSPFQAYLSQSIFPERDMRFV